MPGVDPKLTDVALGDVLGLGAALATTQLSVGGTPLQALPPGWTVTDLSRYLTEPVRARGGVAFADAESFIRYVNKHKDAADEASKRRRPEGADSPPLDPDDLQTVIAVDVINSKFKAIFNHHASDAPGWGDHVATYDCPVSKEWETWTKHSGKKWDDQEEFAFFIEQNMLDIQQPVGAEMLQIVTTIKAHKSANFESGLRLDNGQTQLKYHEEIKGSAGGQGQLIIPEKLKLGIPVYIGGLVYEVEAMFRYRIAGSRLMMWYDLVRPHKILEHALGKMIEQVEAGTKLPPYKVAALPGSSPGVLKD